MTLIGKTSAMAAIAAIAMFCLIAGTAPAHTTSYRSKVTLHIGSAGGGASTVWFGEVTSPKAGCQPNRNVKVFRIEPGPDVRVARGETDSDGHFAIQRPGYPPPNGDYYAKVTRENIGPRGHRHICQVDRSQNVQVQV